MKISAQTSLRTNSQFALQNNRFKSNDYMTKTDYQDGFAKTITKTPQFQIEQWKNCTRVISFCGGKNPTQLLKPALQMKVTGVTHFQHNMKSELLSKGESYAINKLAESEWKDGDEIQFTIEQTQKNKVINLISEAFGNIGRVPDEISRHVLPLLEGDPNSFRFELSNVIAGNTPGASTIGLRVNLLYTGNKPKKADQAQTIFSKILNSSSAAEKVLQYQPVKSPKEIAAELLRLEKEANGPTAAFEMEQIIDNIAETIANHEHKSFLTIGHIKTDTDAAASPLGTKNVIEMSFPDKSVDCATGDDLLGLNDKLPGIAEAFKRPYSEARVKYLEQKIAEEQQTSNNEDVIKGLEKSLAMAKDKSLQLDPDKKYDVVILFDIATPSRLSSEFKKYIQNAKKVIFIDHHPSRRAEWEQAYAQTGVNMARIVKDKLAWIADKMPAAAEQAVIIASKLKSPRNPFFNPEIALKTDAPNPKLDAAVASFAAGMWTDTGSFSRTANLVPKDIIGANGKATPIEQRPNLYPEGVAKWLFGLTHGRISKKWLRDNLVYSLSDIPTPGHSKTARGLMLDYANRNSYRNKGLGLGIMTSSYDEMQNILRLDQIHNPNASIQNVEKEFLYSEVMGKLREPWRHTPVKEQGKYDEDAIIAFIREEEQAGKLNSEWKISPENTLRFSFRSKEGSIYSELLASLFNGGGHGAAAGGHLKGNEIALNLFNVGEHDAEAGGHLKGKGITLNSKFSVIINGQKESDKKKIYEELMKNYKLRKNPKIPFEEQEQRCSKIEVVQDEESGRTSHELIESVTSQIREFYERDVVKDRNFKYFLSD